MSSKKQEENTTSNTGANNADELTALVENLLDALSTKFTTVSSEIFTKMDEMSQRLDKLEAALKASEEKPPGSPSKS